MAEKEKRILVLTTHNEDGECECVTQEGCHANDSCAICNVGMTRQEAIERMAKAIDEAYLNRNKDYIFHFGLLAEAALNALLEADK